MSADPDLRELVAGVVRELVTDLVQESVRDTMADTGPSSASISPVVVSDPRPPTERRTSGRTEAVRIGNDADLDQFARHLLTLFDNPKNRQDLRTGRLRFRLSNAVPQGSSTPGPATRIDTGAVTERQVKAAAEAGRRLILGRRAVLTPLGREKARALDVQIEKEH